MEAFPIKPDHGIGFRLLGHDDRGCFSLVIEFGRAAPGSPERTIVLASLESVRRAVAAARLRRQPKPRPTP
jgi:hypothetical protein